MDPPVEAEFKVVNQKGKDSIIIVDELGYTYSISKSSINSLTPHTRTWRCSKKSKKCTATITTENTWITSRKRFHNHEPGQIIRAEIAKPGDQILLDFFSNQ